MLYVVYLRLLHQIFFSDKKEEELVTPREALLLMLGDHAHSVKLHLARNVIALFFSHGGGVEVGRGDGSSLVLGGDLLPVSEQKDVFARVKKTLQSPNVVSIQMTVVSLKIRCSNFVNK